jgi:hypothetical protein
MSAFDGQGKVAQEGRDVDGHFLPSNKFWRLGKTAGRHRIFETADEFETACFAYFDWVDENPLWQMKVFGTGLKAKLPHPRAMTLRGLTSHIGIGRRTWDDYRSRDEFKDVCEMAEDIMFDQKFSGAAAGLFNASIIARDLGLADKSEVEGNLIIEVVDSYEDNDSE